MTHQTMIGIAQMKVSKDETEILFAPNLGSCLAICVYEANLKIAGMIHCLLPLSKSDPEKAKSNPFLYVDSGLTNLLEQMFAMGADKKSMRITVGGGGNINDPDNVFEIGKKNYTVLKKLLWKNNLLIKAEHIGDSVSRTVSLHVGSGKTYVKVNGVTIELI